MILKQLIQYDNAPAIEATWVDENNVVIKCHAYSNGQMDMLRADLGADAAEHESLISEIEATYEPPEPLQPTPLQLSSLSFLDLFTESEQIDIVTAAMSNVYAKIWYDRTLAAEFITIADPRTELGLNTLISLGFITESRKAEIMGRMFG